VIALGPCGKVLRMDDSTTDAAVEAIIRTAMSAVIGVEARLSEGTEAMEQGYPDHGPTCFADIFGSSFGSAVPSYVMSDSAVFASANGL
jgi:hypothetical protein